MSKQNREGLHTHSSIALLQERFRQLERAKEMREKKELSRQLTNSIPHDLTATYNPSRSFSLFEYQHLPTTPIGDSASTGRTYESKNSALTRAEATPTANLQHKSSNFEDTDIDTSLHL